MANLANDNEPPHPMRHFKPRQRCSNHHAVLSAIISAKSCLWTIYAAVSGDFDTFEDLFTWQSLQYELAERQRWAHSWRKKLYGDKWAGWDDLIG